MKRTMETAGDLLRQWRQHRRMSQLALASEADISQRHLSFLESGRSRPSRDMVMHLAGHLHIPLRERNAILVAAGHAPHYPQHDLGEPELASATALVRKILDGHMPHPALAVNRYWELQAANQAVFALLDGVAPHLLEAPVNVLRLSLHPDGLASRILNLGEWHTHILARLAHEVEQSADPKLAALRDELVAMAPASAHKSRNHASPSEGRIAVPLYLRGLEGTLSFLSTTTVFGTAVDVTLSEIAIEAFFPADAETARQMTAMTNGTAGGDA
ncbi:helix-turn-helix transcriptional regulator [Roseibium sp. FZY0029]|uniref:helix-turn-helix domain-containing protein n=1 Tax=Roseibium sp. FZY0029 TaxID=3116647 RepID=UPI002ECA830F|nr:helix-turn-helix transcriptional regulator [Roseibium sp. FZY0029]